MQHQTKPSSDPIYMDNSQASLRAARLFNQNLDVIWDSCPNRSVRFPLFRDALGNLVPIPPSGRERGEWPVQQAMRSGKLETREYAVIISDPNLPHKYLMRAFPLDRSGHVPLIVEEIEQISPLSSKKDLLEKLDSQVSSLISRMVSNLSEEFGASALNLRFPNPHLQPCYEIRQCQEKSCPAYRSGTARCWEARRDNGSEGAAAEKKHCDQCDVFLQACRTTDPLARICERVNRLLHVLQQKNQEALECYRQVQQAEKLATLGELTTGIAHEIKTPLSVIMGRLDCLNFELESLTPKELAKDLEVIRFHAARMQQVLEEFLNLARPQAPKYQKITVTELIKPAWEVLRKTLEETRIRMALKLAQPSAVLYVDPLQIRQVLLNVILNARDAMSEGGDLTISSSMRSDSGAISIDISDSGCGISPENMQRIFSPFFTTKMGKGGTGLGLMVCKRIMSRHNGSIEVKSEEGKGSTFSLLFPESQVKQ